MAGNIPMGSMSTEIKLNGSQSVKTLRELKQAVTQATSAWKAQRAELSTIGKSTEAAKAKYKGLAETIKKQKDYISGLQEAQKHLQEAQKSVDRSTKEGRQEYGKYNEALQKNETRLHSAQQKLAGLADQQSKAKKSLDYYKSGLAEAQKQLQLNESVTKSYVTRLSSEGKNYEAAKAKLNGYKDSIENLTKQQQIQERELTKIASESGKSSEAYKRQQVRVNETASSLAKAKTQMTELDNSMKKANPSFLDRIRSKLTGVNKEANQTHRTFKEVFAGSFLGNALSNAVSNVAGQLKNTVSEGMALNAAVAKINARFKSMGISAKGIRTLDKQIGNLKAQTYMTGDNIANLQAKMLNWSNIGRKGAMQMTKMIAGVGDSSKLSGNQIEQMGASLMRVGSTGKVTYAALNRVTKSAPTFMAQLAKGAGMSEDKLKSLLKSGKVTQTQFQKWMAAASKYSDTAFKDFGKTQGGALKYMHERWKDLEKTMTKPIFDAKTSGLQSLKNIMSSPELQKGAKAIGNALSTTLGYLDKHKKDIAGVTSDIIHIGVELAKDLWKDFASIVGDIGKSFGLVKGNSKKSQDSLHTVKVTLDGLAKNKTAIQWIAKAIIAMAAVKGLAHLSNGLSIIGYNVKMLANGLGHVRNGMFTIGQKSYGAYKKIKALHAGLKGVQDIKNFDKADQDFFKLGNVISNATGKVKDFIMSAKGIQAGKIFGAVGTALVAGQQGIQAINDRHSADKRSKDIGGSVGAIAGGALTSMIPIVGPWLAPIGAIIGKYAGRWGGEAVNKFTKGWQRHKPPKKFWSLENLGWSTHDMLNKAWKWGAGVAKNFGKGIKKGKSFVKRNSKELALIAVNPILGITALLYKNNPKLRKWANSFRKNIKGGLDKARKSVSNFKKSLANSFKNAWKSAYQHSSKGTKQIMRSVAKFAKNYVKINKKYTDETRKNFGSFSKRLKKNHNDLFKTIGQTAKTQLKIEQSRWSSSWKNIKSLTNGVWKGIKQNASDLYNNLNKKTHSGLGKVFSGFKNFGKNIKDFWHDLWEDITKAFDDAIKNLQNTAKNVDKFTHGKLKVGSLHLANGTDWQKKYGTPAVVNDASGENYREGLLVNGQVIPFPDKRNIPFWLMPGQDIVNGNDMVKMFGHAIHYADGTVHLSKDHKYSKKNYELAKKRAIEDKKELEKLGDKIANALKRKDGNEARRLTSEFNKLTKKYSADKKASEKPSSHAGKILVDQGLLIGAKSRIGHSVYISKSLFKKLIADLKKKDKKKKRKKSTHHRRRPASRRRSDRRRSTSRRRSIRRVPRVSIPKVSSSRVSIKASVSGRAAVRGLASAIRSVKSRSIKLSVKASGSKSISSIAKAAKKIKGGTHRVKVKTSGAKSLKSLYKYAKKIKGKTHKVQVKTSGTKSLKSLRKNITSVHEHIKSLSKTTKNSKFGSNIAKQAEKAVKSLKGKGNFAKQFASMTKKSDEDLKAMTKNSNKEFKSMWSEIQHSSKTGGTDLTHQLNSFSSKYKHGWSSLESGVHKSFDHFWASMENTAGKGVNKVIRVLNSAIGKIDSVISDFGGSKSAVHKSGLVHYATGTNANGRLTSDTLAIVNDAKQGPRQEAIVTDQNDVILPKGNDVPIMLHKGWGVLNGAQTQQLGLPHFANGTHLKDLYELAKHNWGHPQKTGQALFSVVTGLTGAMKELTSGMRSKSEDSGVNWWSQLWKMVEDKVDDDLGPASGLLKAVETLGRGKSYLWGGYGLDARGLDCSGLVSTALEHYYHSGWGHLDVGGLWHHAHKVAKSEAKPGDPVFWLPDEHIGVYAGHGMYYSAYGPNNGGPIGMQSVGSGATFGRFNGINTEKSDSKESIKVKTNGKLQKQIKNQVGQGFWKTIQKIADKYGEQFNGANSISGSMVEAAARKMHVNLPDGFVKDVLRVALSESGNRNIQQQIHDVNSGGNEAQGPLQFARSTFDTYKMPGHTNIHNPYDELLAFFNNSDWKNSIGWTTIWGHRKFDWLHSGPQGHRRFANGGLANKPSIFGEAGPEMAIPLIPSKSTRAWELIGKAIAVLSGQSGLNQQQVQTDTKKEKEEHSFRQAVLLLLTQLVDKSNVADIKLTTPAGRALWSVVEPYSKQEQRAEQIRERRGLSGRFR